MIFTTQVAGIPCQCEVLDHLCADPGQLLGPPEDCYPPRPSEFEFILRDRKGYPANWLAEKLTPDDTERLESEYLQKLNPH